MTDETKPPPTSMSMVLRPQTFDQLVIFSEMAANSDLVPKDYRGKPGNVMIAVQMGSEIGLAPMQAVNSIAIINGRPGVWGDGLIGLCRQSPLCQDIEESFEGQGDTRAAICIAKRRGSAPITSRFSVADAKTAGLWGKSGPWTQYPDRMLQNRARGFALRDAFPDVLRGLKTGEELQDTPADTFRGPTINAKSEPDHGTTMSRRDQINAETKVEAKPRTIRNMIEQLKADLAAAPDLASYQFLVNSEETRKLREFVKSPAKEELEQILDSAEKRFVVGKMMDSYDAGRAAERTEQADEHGDPTDGPLVEHDLGMDGFGPAFDEQGNEVTNKDGTRRTFRTLVEFAEWYVDVGPLVSNGEAFDEFNADLLKAAENDPAASAILAPSEPETPSLFLVTPIPEKMKGGKLDWKNGFSAYSQAAIKSLATHCWSNETLDYWVEINSPTYSTSETAAARIAFLVERRSVELNADDKDMKDARRLAEALSRVMSLADLKKLGTAEAQAFVKRMENARRDDIHRMLEAAEKAAVARINHLGG